MGVTVLMGIFRLNIIMYMQTQTAEFQTIPSATLPRLGCCCCCCYKPTSPHMPLWQHHNEHYGIWFLLMSLHLHLHPHALAWRVGLHQGSTALIWHSCDQYWWLTSCSSPLNICVSPRDCFSRCEYRIKSRQCRLETSMLDKRLCPQASEFTNSKQQHTHVGI